jgi:hypothetical protein
LPIRWIWLKLPEDTAGSGARRVVSRGRDVVAHTPIVAAVDVGASTAPVRVSSVTGTSMAIELTAEPEI